jgi:hypothetical protein
MFLLKNIEPYQRSGDPVQIKTQIKMQFKVPQNVQIEDKILPFMTLRQLIAAGIGGGFAYMLYIGLQNQAPEIWIPPVAIVTVLTLAVTFVRISDLEFIDFVLLALERYLNETKRIWVKSSGDIHLPEIEQLNQPDKSAEINLKAAPDIKKLSSILDNSGLSATDLNTKN